jgi:hypothetical protein
VLGTGTLSECGGTTPLCFRGGKPTSPFILKSGANKMTEPERTNKATDFFLKHVKPVYEEWKKNQTDEITAMNLANNLNNLIDYYWLTYHAEPEKVLNTKYPGIFRKELSRKNMFIGLIRDVADAHKHGELNREGRSLTNADQTGNRKIGFGEAYGLCYGGGELFAIKTDDNIYMVFSEVVEKAYEYWRRELQQ